MVQNRVSLAMPQLPDSVQQQGLTIKKKSPNILLVVNFYSPDGRYDDLYLSNYATINVKDELFRLDGVGDIIYLGQRDYSIRAWLDPQRLASRNMSAGEVVNAIQNQNLAACPGQLGQQPGPAEPGLSDAYRHAGAADRAGAIRRHHREERSDGGPHSPATAIVRLRDVARVELGAQQYDQSSAVDGQPSVGLAIYQLPGTNALDVADRVQRKMAELDTRFPEGLNYGIFYDTTPFIRQSVQDVIITLLEAVGLVALVVLVFLQNWRATVIPLVAVPVAIVGTFAVMAAFGFSLNNISLFGLVLAIGIVVDDAIVVVENVERWLQQGLAAKEAARRAMDEVTGPVIAVALVLCAVFLPCAFLGGITGQFFRQFAVTIAVSTVFSAINSLTLSPALAAILLRPHTAKPDLFARAAGRGGWLVLPLVQLEFPDQHQRLHPAGGAVVARQPAGASGLRRPAGADLQDVRPRAGRLCSSARPGLADGQRATARLGLGRADQGGAGPDRPNRARHGRGCAYVWRGRPVAAIDHQQLEFRLDVRHLEAIRPAAQAGTQRRGDHGPLAAEVFQADQGRPGERVRRRRCRASA